LLSLASTSARAVRATGTRIGAAAGGLAATVAVAMPCTAQVDHAASRSIGDTTFLLPALADSAFILTEFGLRQDVTVQSIPGFPVASFTRADLSWVQVQERIDTAVRITDWLGVYGQASGSAAVGLDLPSLLFQGGGLAFAARGGLALRVLRSEESRTQVTLRGYGGGGAGRTLDLLDFFGAVSVQAVEQVQQIAAQARDPAQVAPGARAALGNWAGTNYADIIMVPVSTQALGTSLHLAQGIVGPLTLQLAGAVEWDWESRRPFDPTQQVFAAQASTDTTINLDAAVSCDFNRWKVPLGVSFEADGIKTYRTLNGVSSYVPSTYYVGGGLFFTGRRGLELGALLFSEQNLKPTSGFDTATASGEPHGYIGTLVFRALW